MDTEVTNIKGGFGKHVSVFTALTAGCSVERDVSTPVTIHNNR